MPFSLLLTILPFVLAGIAALYSERAGLLHIGIEGFILFGAFSFASFATIGGIPLFFSMPVSIFMSLIPGFIFSYLVVFKKANLYIMGLAINLLAAGLIPVLSQFIFNTKTLIRFNSNESDFYIILAVLILSVIGAAFILDKTKPGLRIKAAGSCDTLLSSRGLNPANYQFAALMTASGLAAMAGILLVLTINAYVPNISSGRGWIGLVLVYMGFRKVPGVFLAGIFFGISEIAGQYMQDIIPPALSLITPYLLGLIAIIFSKNANKSDTFQN